MSDTFRPLPGAPAGWYPLPGGGQRYWDGVDWAGAPVPPADQPRSASDPFAVRLAVGASILLTPLAGLLMAALRYPRNPSDAKKMASGAAAVAIVYVLLFVLLYAASTPG